MLFIYPAIFHKEDGYWVEFPDLEGCQTSGDTLNEAMESAQEAMSAYLESVFDRNIEIKKPSNIEAVEYDTTSFVTLVTCNVNPYRNTKAVKKTLTIPAWLNEKAMAQNLNFSQILQDALLEKIIVR